MAERKKNKDKEELPLLHLPVERTRCFLKWRICFTRGSQRETQQPRGTGRGCKCGKVMGPNGSAPRLRREPTHRHSEASKLTWHSWARIECWSRWMTLAKHLLSLSWGEGDKLVGTNRPARQGAQTTHPFGVGSVCLADYRRMDLPHLVWIDVDACWKATSASDKSEEPAAILCEGKAKPSAKTGGM